MAERDTSDVLDRALLRAHNSKLNGVLLASEYHKISHKIDSLRKLRFTDDYERLMDKSTYEWMKYKVAAEVGGEEERTAFSLYEKTHVESKGELKFRLWRDAAEQNEVFAFLSSKPPAQ